MNKQQSGFTLIELVVVIVILGVLAATALPKFIDLKSDAEAAAVKGVAGGFSSAFAVNYAGAMAGKGTAVTGATLDVKSAASNVMVGGVPSEYSVTPSTVNCTGAGMAASVTISNTKTTNSGVSASATLVCTG